MESGHILEATTTTLEWKVTGLKKLFDSSKGEAKSKVTRSVKFGGGKWQVSGAVRIEALVHFTGSLIDPILSQLWN
jgi:hypothetical protein